MESTRKNHLQQLLDTDSTLRPALASSLLCWLAFPPVGWWLLAWVAPLGWLALVQRNKPLTGVRPYRTLWLAGIVFWLLTIHWLRLPHLANYLALPILASYLGVYLPLFVALARVGVHRLRLPLWLVAPIVWTGLDWVRGNFMTGFLMGSLAHTQVDFLDIIQVACFVGEYGITFLIVLFASGVAQFLLVKHQGWFQRSLPLVIATVIVGFAVFLGTFLASGHVKYQRASSYFRVALIQGNTLADWKADPDRQFNIMREYARLSDEAVQKSQTEDNRDVDLIIWPETAYRNTYYTTSPGFQPPADWLPPSELDGTLLDLAAFTQQTDAAFLTGVDRLHLFNNDQGKPDFEQFNSSIMFDKQGQLVGHYDKMHLVIMGEYVPFTDWIPFLKNFTPTTGLANPGKQPKALESGGIVYCPNVCYETCVPHLIRRQMKELAEAGTPPDVLVNLTNDAWFWGSSELDMHLACGVFRAVEMRRPLLIAANGGLSAHVDPYGRVLQKSARQETAVLLVDLPQQTGLPLTFYARYGDWFAELCVVCCIALAAVAYRTRPQPS